MTPLPCIFQAAVELPLLLAFQDQSGHTNEREYLITAVAERVGLNELDVVIDFRILEAALIDAIEPMRGRSPQDLGMNGYGDLAEKIAQSLAPVIKAPVRLAAVSIQDGSKTIASFACDACLAVDEAHLQASRGQHLQANPGLERLTFSKLNRSIAKWQP